MNMKKTIAGVMAGAMAVSAMATMVSADQDSISLTYDLKKYVEVKNDTKGKLQLVLNFVNGASDYGFNLANTDAKGPYIEFDASGQYVTLAHSIGADWDLKDVEVSFTSLKNLITDAPQTTITRKLYDSDISDQNQKDQYTLNGFTPYKLDGTGVKLYLDTVGSAATAAADTLVISGFNNETLGQTSSAYAYSFQQGYVKLTYELPTIIVNDPTSAWMNPDENAYPGLGWLGSTNISAYINAILGLDTTKETNLGANDFAANTNVSHAGILGTPQPLAVGSFTAGANSEKIYPLKSSLNNPANVTQALVERKAGGKYYTNPVAVLNDAIANNENVVFEFKSYNGYVATAKTALFTGWALDVDRAYGYQVCQYDWYNPTFGQHLYTNLDNSYSLMGSTEFDMYGSYSSAWAQNLFTGAIVVNSGLTMQLSDTDKFNWGSDTLSFDWFTITDEGKVTEAKTFLTKMLLYTPVDWYWDSLTVTVGNLETDEVEPGAGALDDGDEIDDGGDEIVIDPVDTIDDPVVVDTEPVVVTEAPVTEATPVAPVSSPKTGNAPVALAVIPVALAAAAVVAKKRG
ncbi:MAG: hypothetical protein K2N72_01160 [Oscillospiraceae bacterium]|nr:hypothetical protein [Oscillospiraceae bacterium]